MNTRKLSYNVLGLRVLKSFVSIGVLTVSARLFGVSIERDIWILAANCILVLDLALWGPLNETFRARFIVLKEKEGEQKALHDTFSLILVSIFLTSLIAVGAFWHPQSIAKLIAPIYYESSQHALLLMIRLLLPTMIIGQGIQLITGVLNSYQSFYLPELAGIFSGLTNIVLLFVLAPFIHIYALVVAQYISMTILAGLLIYRFHKIRLAEHFRTFRPGEINWRNILPFFKYALPFYLPYSIGQLNSLLEKSLANTLGPGIVSLLDYSRRFIDIPVNALMSILTSVLLPLLTTHFARNKQRFFYFEFLRTLQFGLIIVSIVVGLLILNAELLVTLVYGNNKLTVEQLQVLAKLIQVYSISAVAIMLYSICGLALIAAGRGKVFALYGTLAQLLMIGANCFFYNRWGIYTFPVSLFGAHLLVAVILLVVFPVKKQKVVVDSAKYFLLLPLAITVPYFFQYMISSLPLVSKLAINCVLFLTSLLTLVYFLDLKEKAILTIFIKKMNKK